MTLFLKVVMFCSSLIFAGREFQSLGAAREKAQPPSVFLDLPLGLLNVAHQRDYYRDYYGDYYSIVDSGRAYCIL